MSRKLKEIAVAAALLIPFAQADYYYSSWTTLNGTYNGDVFFGPGARAAFSGTVKINGSFYSEDAISIYSGTSVEVLGDFVLYGESGDATLSIYGGNLIVHGKLRVISKTGSSYISAYNGATVIGEEGLILSAEKDAYLSLRVSSTSVSADTMRFGGIEVLARTGRATANIRAIDSDRKFGVRVDGNVLVRGLGVSASLDGYYAGDVFLEAGTNGNYSYLNPPTNIAGSLFVSSEGDLSFSVYDAVTQSSSPQVTLASIISGDLVIGGASSTSVNIGDGLFVGGSIAIDSSKWSSAYYQMLLVAVREVGFKVGGDIIMFSPPSTSCSSSVVIYPASATAKPAMVGGDIKISTPGEPSGGDSSIQVSGTWIGGRILVRSYHSTVKLAKRTTSDPDLGTRVGGIRMLAIAGTTLYCNLDPTKSDTLIDGDVEIVSESGPAALTLYSYTTTGSTFKINGDLRIVSGSSSAYLNVIRNSSISGAATDVDTFHVNGNLLLGAFGGDASLDHNSVAEFLVNGDVDISAFGNVTLKSASESGTSSTFSVRGNLAIAGGGEVSIATDGDCSFEVGGNLASRDFSETQKIRSVSVDTTAPGNSYIRVGRNVVLDAPEGNLNLGGKFEVAGDLFMRASDVGGAASSSSVSLNSVAPASFLVGGNVIVKTNSNENSSIDVDLKSLNGASIGGLVKIFGGASSALSVDEKTRLSGVYIAERGGAAMLAEPNSYIQLAPFSSMPTVLRGGSVSVYGGKNEILSGRVEADTDLDVAGRTLVLDVADPLSVAAGVNLRLFGGRLVGSGISASGARVTCESMEWVVPEGENLQLDEAEILGFVRFKGRGKVSLQHLRLRNGSVLELSEGVTLEILGSVANDGGTTLVIDGAVISAGEDLDFSPAGGTFDIFTLRGAEIDVAVGKTVKLGNPSNSNLMLLDDSETRIKGEVLLP